MDMSGLEIAPLSGGDWGPKNKKKIDEHTMRCFQVIVILMLKFEIAVFRIFCFVEFLISKLKGEMVGIKKKEK